MSALRCKLPADASHKFLVRFPMHQTHTVAVQLLITLLTHRQISKISNIYGRALEALPLNCKLCQRPLFGNRRYRCNSCNTKIRRIRAKNAAIAYLGGKCVECGYDKHPAGLEFHHVTGDKDFTIANVANRAWEIIKKELDKCVLLCCICHRIHHSNRTEAIWIEEAANYHGRLFQ